VKTSLQSVISVHFCEFFSVFPGKPVRVVDECYCGVVDVCDALAGDEEMLLWSVRGRHCSANLRTDTIMPTELV